MVQSSSWEANWSAANQEISRTSRNPNVHYRTHKRPPPISILVQPNPVHIPTSCRSILILTTHLRLGLPSGLFPSGFPTKTLYTPSPHPYAPHAQPISFFSILSPAQYWVRSTNHLAPRYAISSIPISLQSIPIRKVQCITFATELFQHIQFAMYRSTASIPLIYWLRPTRHSKTSESIFYVKRIAVLGSKKFCNTGTSTKIITPSPPQKKNLLIKKCTFIVST